MPYAVKSLALKPGSFDTQNASQTRLGGKMHLYSCRQRRRDILPLKRLQIATARQAFFSKNSESTFTFCLQQLSPDAIGLVLVITLVLVHSDRHIVSAPP